MRLDLDTARELLRRDRVELTDVALLALRTEVLDAVKLFRAGEWTQDMRVRGYRLADLLTAEDVAALIHEAVQ